MQLPDNMTEAEVMEIVDKIARCLAPKWVFGFNEVEDIRQYARMFAIQGVDRYNPSIGTLETFLWTHVKNRLCNLKRDKYERPDKPCITCPLNAYDPNCANSTSQCTEYSDKMSCDLYKTWYNRNAKRRNIINPINLGNVDDEHEKNMQNSTCIDTNLFVKSVVEAIDKDIPISLRHLWIKLQNGFLLSKADRNKLLPVLATILEKAGLSYE